MKRAWLGVVLLAMACDRPKPPAPLPGVNRIAWRLGFDDARLQRGTDGWRLHTTQGFDVHVTSGVLTTWRLGLEPCPKPVAWSLIPQAYAHHVEPPDPTSLMPHLAEDLTQLTATDVGPRDVPETTYCRALWLASAPPPALAGDGPRVSLLLRGTWHKGGQSGTLDVDTWMPDARFAPVPGLKDAHGSTQIVVDRHVAAALDAVDLANTPTPALAWTILHKLVADADWRAVPTTGSASTR